ncbi:ATP-citrate lyase [Pelomyxa schiedti]|nr:ATP-citrate lyase [Pelomyxa schiedti]
MPRSKKKNTASVTPTAEPVVAQPPTQTPQVNATPVAAVTPQPTPTPAVVATKAPPAASTTLTTPLQTAAATPAATEAQATPVQPSDQTAAKKKRKNKKPKKPATEPQPESVSPAVSTTTTVSSTTPSVPSSVSTSTPISYATASLDTVTNACGRVLPKFIPGYGKVTPFMGAHALTTPTATTSPTFQPNGMLTPKHVVIPGQSKMIATLREALVACGLRNGMTLSFHHHLREGDAVVLQCMTAVEQLGVKDITIAPTALFNVHAPLADMVKRGTIKGIIGSLNGAIGMLASEGGIPTPAVLRSHGGRVRAIMQGDLRIDIAVIAAPCADEYGNANGVLGKSACGPLAYSNIDARCASRVIVVTDYLMEYPCIPISIPSTLVDFVVKVDSIGDPKKIVSGTTRIADTDEALESSRLAALCAYRAGYVKNGFGLQAGAGGSSLTSVKFLSEIMQANKIVAGWANGGTTAILVDMLRKGLVKKLSTCQAFDIPAVESLRDDPKVHCEIDIDQYANPLNRGAVVNLLDVVVLGATEVDVNFNCNVNTHADGYLLHGIGGHQDTAAGSKLTIITCPVARGINPIVVDNVVSITTPGECIHVIVTDEGIAINPQRKDLLEKLAPYADELKLKTIQELRDIGYRKAGRVALPPKTTDRIIGVIEWRDGTVLDVVREPLHRPKDLRCDCTVKVEKQDLGTSIYGVKVQSYDRNAFVSEAEAVELATRILSHFSPHFSNPRQSVTVTIGDCSSLPWVMAARIEHAVKCTFPEVLQAPPFLLPLDPNVPDQSTIAINPDHLRRSQLYIPGRDPYMMSKAGSSGEDGAIFDLEDAVAPPLKAASRILVRNALRALDFRNAERLVRINQGAEGLQDISVILPYCHVDGLVIPKVDIRREIEILESHICQVCKWESSRVALFPLIETAVGIENINDILRPPHHILGICMGLEDYTADCGMIKSPSNEESSYAIRRLANAAHAARVPPLDTVFGDFGNIDGLKTSITLAKSLGYVGKRCVHPKQITICNSCFAPTEQELTRAKDIVRAFNKAGASGVVALGAKMIDRPVVLRAQKTIATAIKLGILKENWE